MKFRNSILIGILLITCGTNISFAIDVDDSRVKNYIASSLSTSDVAPNDSLDSIIGKVHSTTIVQNGWERLKRCRDAGNSQDLTLAAAEHYMFMRFVSGKSGDAGFRKLPKWYEIVKDAAVRSDLDKLIQASDQPVSAPNPKVTHWGELGVENGLQDYKIRENKEPTESGKSLITLVGFSYATYYYSASGQKRIITGVCDLLQSPQGVWEATHPIYPSVRFRLVFSGNQCTWTQSNVFGDMLTREVSLRRSGNQNIFKISRNNDAEVLRWKKYRPDTINEILARAPEPSFMILEFTGDKLSAEWNDLRITYQPNELNPRLKTMKQPGQGDPIHLEFIKK